MDNKHRAMYIIENLQMLNRLDKDFLTTHAQRNACQHLVRVLQDELRNTVEFYLFEKKDERKEYPDVNDVPF